MRKNLSPFLFALLSLTVACVDGSELSQSAQAASARASFELFEDVAGEYRFNLVAKNGEVVLTSEGYGQRLGALGGMLAVLANADDADAFELAEAYNGEWYFVLVAGNGETVGVSELYTTKSGAKKGTGAVAKAAKEIQAVASKKTGAGFHRFVGQDGQHYFHLKAKNGKIIFASEGYKSAAGAWNGTFAVVDAVENGAFEIREAQNGEFYFVLIAANGEIVAVSETYTTFSSAWKACQRAEKLVRSAELL